MTKTLVLALALLARVAAADPAPTPPPKPKLELERQPPHLAMRPRAAQATKRAPPRPSPIPQPPKPRTAGVDDDDPGDAALVRDVRDKVSVRVNLGYQVDGTTLTGQPTLGGTTPKSGMDFATIRSYGFGEGYLSTRGVGVSSVSSYLSGRFMLTDQVSVNDPTNPYAKDGSVPIAPPIANWFEKSGVQGRAAWLELKDFLPDHRFAPLRLRAGELYIYGPWVMHMYGAITEWDGKLVTANAYAGSRVPDYTLELPQEDRAAIGGATLRFDLRGLASPIPITVGGEYLSFASSQGEGSSRHSQIDIDWRPRENFGIIGQARAEAGSWANEHLQIRTRYKQVTNVVLDVTLRQSDDWLWDPAVIKPENLDDPTAPRRYLDLGPVLPRVVGSLRAGTLIAENVDLLLRTAAGIDLTSSTDPKSSYSSSYAEIGGALEVRLRRTIAVGASALSRQTVRHDLISAEIPDVPGTTQPLPAADAMGERGFTEIGTSVKMSLGARKFSAVVEVYGRRTRYALDYCIPGMCDTTGDTGLPTSEIHGGGRFTVDAWIGERLRLFASYDVSSRIDFAPEITGYKSLKLMMEGVY